MREFHRRMVEAFSPAVTEWDDADVVALAHGLDRLRGDFRRTVARPEEVA